jgi:tRNA splicing ligase
MDNKDLLNAGTGYVAGRSIIRGVADSLRRQREEMEKKLAHITSKEVLSAEVAKFLLKEDKKGAYEYLNDHFNEEIIDAAQNQADFIYSLETMLKK